MRPKVYLAGPAEVEDSWRDRATKALDKLGFDVINPMRGEKLRQKRGDIASDISDKLIVTRDHYDMNQVRLSGGFFLMNFSTTAEGRDPMGTLMELEWAWIHNVPVIGILGRDAAAIIKNHPWVKELVTHPSTSLKAALELIEQYFCYAVGEESKLKEDD